MATRKASSHFYKKCVFVQTLAIDTVGNIYVAGGTRSEDIPITPGAYQTSFNGGTDDAFVSRLNNSLTSLLASTYLGGNGDDQGDSLAIDTDGNVYVAGQTGSFDFPTTPGAYQTSKKSKGGNSNTFVSRLSGDLSKLLASTYLGGSKYEVNRSMAIDTVGNIYVAGGTRSTDFPTTPGAYQTFFNDDGAVYSWNIFVSRLNGSLTSLLASTYFGRAITNDPYIVIDPVGNIYVAGAFVDSPDFPTTLGAYDTSFEGGDAFISKFDGNLSAGTAKPPTVTTGDASDITLNSATLKGVVNANGLDASAWFEYGVTSGGPYLNSNTQTVTGSSDTPVSIGISGLSAGTKYYYRLVAENTAGKTEGSEKSFTTSSSELMFPLENYLNWQQTQPFGNFYCQCPYNGKHLGEDRSLGEKGILAKGTPVKAIANGTVKRHRNLATLGDYVHLQHTLSDGRKITSVYYHIQKIWTGKPDVDLIEGSTVEKGKVVGYITDKRKDYGTAPHLHFGIRKGEYKEGCDPLTNVWYYPGYTTIYLCKTRVPPGRCCREKAKYPKYDCARSCEASKRDPIHRRVINEWVDPVRFILGQVTDFEVCGNGIDDDGDTLIDSEDPDCGG